MGSLGGRVLAHHGGQHALAGVAGGDGSGALLGFAHDAHGRGAARPRRELSSLERRARTAASVLLAVRPTGVTAPTAEICTVTAAPPSFPVLERRCEGMSWALGPSLQVHLCAPSVDRALRGEPETAAGGTIPMFIRHGWGSLILVELQGIDAGLSRGRQSEAPCETEHDVFSLIQAKLKGGAQFKGSEIRRVLHRAAEPVLPCL